MTTGPSLGDVLRVCRRVLRVLDPNRAGSLGRIDGGFHLRAPGVSLAIRRDSVEVRRWDLSQTRRAATLEFVARLLDPNPTFPPLTGQRSLPDDHTRPPLSRISIDDAVVGQTDDGEDRLQDPNEEGVEEISL